jgi:dienelactone hydrolase
MAEHVGVLQEVCCQHEDLVLKGKIALPAERGPHPAVLVVHTAFGLGGHIPLIVERLAAQGFVALAVDMFGGGAYSEDPQAIAQLVKPLWGNADRLRSRMDAWLALLRNRPEVVSDRIAAIGYCFGGQCVLELARSGADVRAVVSFHGILTTERPAARGQVRAHVSVHTGALDPHAPTAHVEALRAELGAAGAEWQITEYGNAYHAFTDPAAQSPEIGRSYNALADQISWSNTLGLLSAMLKS